MPDELSVYGEPVVSQLVVLWARPDGWGQLNGERQGVLRQKLRSGELDELRFRARTFRAVYPNSNYLRFRDEDLPALASSYAGQPFLRDHDAEHIESRAGSVVSSALEGDSGSGGPSFIQEIALTVPRDIEAFLNGQMDRFSISWFWQGITCSVCGLDWLGGSCMHWPGQRYKSGPGGSSQEAVCELIFEKPTGKEVSAVNVPAVVGTGVREVLGRLCAVKQARLGGEAGCRAASPSGKDMPTYDDDGFGEGGERVSDDDDGVGEGGRPRQDGGRGGCLAGVCGAGSVA